MLKHLTFQELAQISFLADEIECHRQIWREGSEWVGYETNPRHSDGLLLFCSDIVGELYVDGEKLFSASRGDAVYIPHSSLYKIKFKNGGTSTDLYTVNFKLTDVNGTELRMAEGITLLPTAASHSCRDAASRLADALLLSGSKLKKQALFMCLLDAFTFGFEKHSKSYYTVRKGVALLQEEWNKNEKMSRYAQVCGISESGFYTYFKKWAGCSPTDYRNKIRINAAKSMLANSNLQISEIAFNTGFDDPYYFSRLFKKLVGVSPRAFRNS